MKREPIINAIADLFEKHGTDWYMGESVTMAQHMLQSAWFAQRADATASDIAGALLHDIGHYTSGQDENCLHEGQDNYHETAGADFLSGHFPLEVTEPIRLHVAAKRYLCATDPKYFDRLSAASVESLALQGGPMSTQEVAVFEENPHHQAAVRLRFRDEAGKDPELTVPELESYLPLLESLLRES
ncbi:MAG: HD domain-containing protein [Halieaceae bacterium]|jgi:[1-hydroxy-2-(trimethylamino)ethyl]phosphonate dioxygenase|nr:HD domain-containing protein [Halieaceae bacterium]